MREWLNVLLHENKNDHNIDIMIKLVLVLVA